MINTNQENVTFLQTSFSGLSEGFARGTFFVSTVMSCLWTCVYAVVLFVCVLLSSSTLCIINWVVMCVYMRTKDLLNF